jgi:hypothetical protein
LSAAEADDITVSENAGHEPRSEATASPAHRCAASLRPTRAQHRALERILEGQRLLLGVGVDGLTIVADVGTAFLAFVDRRDAIGIHGVAQPEAVRRPVCTVVNRVAAAAATLTRQSDSRLQELRVMSRNARSQQITSALPAKGDLSETCQIRCDGPGADLRVVTRGPLLDPLQTLARIGKVPECFLTCSISGYRAAHGRLGSFMMDNSLSTATQAKPEPPLLSSVFLDLVLGVGLY